MIPQTAAHVSRVIAAPTARPTTDLDIANGGKAFLDTLACPPGTDRADENAEGDLGTHPQGNLAKASDATDAVKEAEMDVGADFAGSSDRPPDTAISAQIALTQAIPMAAALQADASSGASASPTQHVRIEDPRFATHSDPLADEKRIGLRNEGPPIATDHQPGTHAKDAAFHVATPQSGQPDPHAVPEMEAAALAQQRLPHSRATSIRPLSDTFNAASPNPDVTTADPEATANSTASPKSSLAGATEAAILLRAGEHSISFKEKSMPTPYGLSSAPSREPNFPFLTFLTSASAPETYGAPASGDTFVFPSDTPSVELVMPEAALPNGDSPTIGPISLGSSEPLPGLALSLAADFPRASQASLQIHIPTSPTGMPSILPPETAPALVQALGQTSSDTVELMLTPDDLGRLRFALTQTGDQLRIHLMVERPETLDLLRRHADQVLSEFRQAGYAGATLSFGQWSQGGQQHPSAQSPFAEPTAPPAAEQPAPQPEPLHAAPLTRSPTTGLDLRF